MGETPFFHACRDDLTLAHKNGTTPLEAARQMGRRDVVAWLEPIVAKGIEKGGAACYAQAIGRLLEGDS